MALGDHTKSLVMSRHLQFKCYCLSVTLYGRLKWLTAIPPNLCAVVEYIRMWAYGPRMGRDATRISAPVLIQKHTET